MKFIRNFAICFVLIAVFLFLGGYMLLENVWGAAAVCAVVAAVIISAFAEQQAEIDALKQRIEQLENKKDDL